MSPMNEISFKAAVISKCYERIEIGIEDSTISNALYETANYNDPARLLFGRGLGRDRTLELTKS